MKKLTIILIICFCIAIACTKKVVPVISSRTEFPEPPKSAKPAVTGTTPEMLEAGKKIYGGKCVRCHDLKEPDVYDASKWETILKSMIPKARLNEQQAGELKAYVMSNAKK